MIANLVLLALPFVIGYLATTIWYRRFKQYAAFPQLKPSLLWGHMRAIHEFTLRAPPKMHFGRSNQSRIQPVAQGGRLTVNLISV